jgi:fatty acid-binding protein DegV
MIGLTVRVVTDSTCDLPDDCIEQYGITVVPNYINFDGSSYRDGVSLSRQEFYERLPTLQYPAKTSSASPYEFAQTYERLARQGASQIISIHATVRTVPVTVFDSGQLSLGLGFQALVAAQEAALGRRTRDIITTLEDMAARVFVVAVLDTLDYLRRSGRVSALQSRLGSILKIKPLMTVHCGQIEMVRERTARHAIGRLMQMVDEHAPLEQLGVLHTRAVAAAQDLYQKVAQFVPQGTTVHTLEAAPVIGAHAGPGAVGLAFVAAQ